MGRDGTVVEIREDAERAWLFEISDWIVAAMDEFLWADVLLFENIFEKRACLFHESAFVGDIERQFREYRRNLRQKLLDVFGLQIHVRNENNAFAFGEKIVDYFVVGADGACVFQFEIELERLQEVPLNLGKRAHLRQKIIDVVEIDVFCRRGFPCVRFGLSTDVMEVFRDIARYFRMAFQ